MTADPPTEDTESGLPEERREFNPYQAPEADCLSEENLKDDPYASSAERLAAFLVDFGILLSLSWGVAALGGRRYGGEPIAVWAFLPISWIYFTLLEAAPFQATAGKWFLGARVVGERDRKVTWLQATGRYFAKWFSGILFGFGFAMQPFTDQKQALHDMMSGTLVERV
jgi:uncharacterized RDD family membrane protein YckC